MAESTKATTSAKPAANRISTAVKAPVKKTEASATNSPVKKPRTKKVTGPTVAVFIDIENTNASRDNLLEIFTNLKTKATVTYGKLYGYRFDKAADYDEIVAENRLETVGRMRFKHGDDSVIDARLIVDCIVAAESRKYDSIFVWAGVGDLMSLFAHIKQQGVKVMTVDLTVFDCENKFVDQKLKLFSPHKMTKPAPVTATPAPAPAAAAPGAALGNRALDSLLAGKTVPVLPRKDGAPELAKKETIADDSEDFEDFDESELEELEEIVDDDNEINDEDSDADLDDFDDLGDEEDHEDILDQVNIDIGEEVFDAEENEKLRALSQELLKATKKGKAFDAKKAAQSMGSNSSGRRDDFSDLGTLEDEDTGKHAYFSAATQYDADSSDEAPDDKVTASKDEKKDEFNDFGNL